VSRKDYKMIALAISNSRRQDDSIDTDELLALLCAVFAGDNPRFDTVKFLSATAKREETNA